MKYWIDDSVIPDDILALLDMSETPSELWKEIAKAHDELREQGNVTYPTKGNIEHYLHKYYDND